jgi:hypothetical protein
MEKKLPGYGQNYIIKNKQDIEKREHMEKRLAAVTGFIDNKLSYAKKPMRNVKKEMVDESRYAQIEKDNLLLLQRMHAVSLFLFFLKYTNTYGVYAQYPLSHSKLHSNITSLPFLSLFSLFFVDSS